MFDVGFWEILLVLVIALIVVGPERLPKLARTAGLWIGKARSIVASVRAEVERELRVEELKHSIQSQAPTAELKKLAEQVKSINSEVQSLGKDLQATVAADPGANQAPSAAPAVASPAAPPSTKEAAPSTQE
jgi:sec-independent protein translocase protein TatB